MKNTLLSFGLAGLTSALLSFTFIQKSDEPQEPKKERHIRMTKIENGKKMELDTILTTDDVFVWNGDTINPNKPMGKFRHPEFAKRQQMDITVDRKGGKENIMIFRHNDGKPGEPMIWNMDSGENMEIITEDVDSLGKKIVVKKRMKGGDKDHMIYFSDADRNHFPPMPPVPPVPHVKMMKMQHARKIIDLNDPNIISYKKKEMSGDREKIEIIRKKSDAPENMTFDFEFDHNIDVPEAPVHIEEFDDADHNTKMMEKEIKVEVETEENK